MIPRLAQRPDGTTVPRATAALLGVLGVLGVLAGIVVVVVATRVSIGSDGEPQATAANRAAELSGTAIDGRSWNLGDQKGHWVVVAFQAKWCTPCRVEVKELKKLLATRPEVRVVTVGYASSVEETKDFASSLAITWPAIPDAQARIAESWKVVGLPATVLVDPEGRIAHSYVGGLTAGKLGAAIDTIDTIDMTEVTEVTDAR